jgi:hypothetical protein
LPAPGVTINIVTSHGLYLGLTLIPDSLVINFSGKGRHYAF